jgi:hypothetical protein
LPSTFSKLLSETGNMMAQVRRRLLQAVRQTRLVGKCRQLALQQLECIEAEVI